jgi:uncharacterized protein YbaP (TraB family)
MLSWVLLSICAATVQAAGDRGLFYRVEHDGAVVYLLGSIHLAQADMYPLRAALTDAYAAADALVVEVDINAVDPQRMLAWVNTHGLYPPGESLRDHLQPATWRRLQNYLRSQGIDSALVARQKPGLLVTTLSAMRMTAGGLSAALGIDAFFLDRAHRERKPIVELESFEEQLTLLSELPNPDLLINQTLDEMAELQAITDRMLDAWRQGDAERLAALLAADDLQQHPEYRVLFEQIYTRRNHAMTARVRHFLAAGGNHFVVVGAAHLVGEDGIVALLRRAGFKVEQL